MTEVPYIYLRALELEGRHPTDAGSWSTTNFRITVGEGAPDIDSPFGMTRVEDGDPLPPAPKLPAAALRANRQFFYRRVRSTSEYERLMHSHPGGVHCLANLPLTAAWADPVGGHIPMPTEAELLPNTHGVLIWGMLGGQPTLLFNNFWGVGWGNKGRGALPGAYFDRYCFDSWTGYSDVTDLRLYREKRLGSHSQLQWSGRDENDNTRYGYEVRDAQGVDRLGWSFAVDRDGAVEVEELYVRPEYRRVGHGRWLAERLAELARAKKMPLRLWVPFSDAQRESGATFPALLAVARRLGLQFVQAGVPWAAYLATNERPGSETPVEPDFFPARPRSTRSDLLAAVLALGIGGAGPGSAAPQPVAASVVADFPAVGTTEWGRMNQERAALIRKKVRGELTEAERERYEYLQSRSLSAVEQAFPRGGAEPA